MRNVIALITGVFLLLGAPLCAASFTAFESGQVRPLALSPDGNRLFAVNTPDNRLEIFGVSAAGLMSIDSVPVGLEPVAVAARSNSEVWVVNHLSDSISIVDVAANPPRVVRTLLVGDEPRDIVFAGPGDNRAFVTTAHRGQNSPLDPQLTTPGVGRADVWVFNATDPGSQLGGSPLTIITLFTDTPRALAVSADGGTVYAAGFHTGNRTTAISEGAVCPGGATAGSCTPGAGNFTLTAPGGLPAPNANTGGVTGPEVGLIVQHNGLDWVDELGRNWNDMVRFDLPDKDVFAINANANPPVETAFFPQVGTVIFNMAVNPVNGKVYVANTEARNEVRFEGSRPPASTTSTVQGRLHQARITVIDGSSVLPRHINKHIDYNVSPAPVGVKEKSLALPMGMAVTGDGATLYLAAFGSGKVGVFDTVQLENNSFVPNSANHIPITGGGASGLVLDEARNRLYVLTRFDNSVSMVDTTTNTETAHYSLHNPEPANVVDGRPFLYDAAFTSSNGEASCASCHVFADFDSLAWDLGDPEGTVASNPNLPGPLGGTDQPFHPMKGPMTTQSLRGLADHGPMHWRGDRTAGSTGGDPLDEFGAFMAFNVAFEGLLGRAGPLTDTEMQAFTAFILDVTYPPNPVRALDNVLTTDQQAGRDFYMTQPSVGVLTCNTCHAIAPGVGFFGSNGLMSFEAESQEFKIPQLRNMYQKVGMFGMPPNDGIIPGDAAFMGDQVRGFGFIHDGSVDTMFRFHSTQLFSFPGGAPQIRQVESFMHAFDSNLKPVVGQQITLTDTNSGAVNPRVDLLIARANAGDADLVVKGILGGEQRGWHRLSNGSFQSDKSSESSLTETQLRNLAIVPGQPLTFMAVPPGSGARIGIDRDEDTILDNDDNCPIVNDLDQTDTDGDGAGNACDEDDDNDGLGDLFEATIGTNALLADSDGDGLTDFEEVAFDGDSSQYTPGQDLNPLLTDTDGDGLSDANDPIPLTLNVGDGDLAPWNAPDGSINAGDLLIATRLALGTLIAQEEQLAHGDLYPPGAPDGKITVQDLILLQKLVLP